MECVRSNLTGQDIYLSVSSQKFIMLRAGDLFRAGKQGGVVGAFIEGRNRCIGVTAYHIIRLAGTKSITIGTEKAEVVSDWWGFDLAYFKASGCEPTPLGQPRLGPAQLASAMGARNCDISDVGDLLAVVIGHADMPEPGESGTPLFWVDRTYAVSVREILLFRYVIYSLVAFRMTLYI